MTPEAAAALEAVALRLQAAGLPFLLGGSALLHALGLDVAVGDIDLVLREGDRAALEAAAAGWWRGTTTEPAGVVRSAWKASLVVGGVDVDALGGLAWEAAPGGPVVTMPFRAAGAWRCGSAEVPLAPAEHWLLLYEAYRPDRARRLAPLVGEAARLRALAELAQPLPPTCRNCYKA